MVIDYKDVYIYILQSCTFPLPYEEGLDSPWNDQLYLTRAHLGYFMLRAGQDVLMRRSNCSAPIPPGAAPRSEEKNV